MIYIIVLIALVVVVAVSRRAITADLPPTVAGADASGFGAARGSVDWPAAATLGLGESRRLLLHPAFLAGLVLTLLALKLTNEPGPHAMYLWGPDLVLRFVPLGWFTIVAANLAVLRARRHGTVELYATTPVTPATITTAHLLTAIAAGLVGTILVAVAVGAELLLSDPIGRLDIAETVVGALIVGGAVVVGVAVARWLPWFLFGFAAVIAVTAIEGVVGSSQTGTLRFFAFVAPTTSAGHPFLDSRPSVWHALFVVSMTVLLAGVALARHGTGRAAISLLVIGALAAAGTGWAQSRPLDERSALARVSFLAGEDGAHRCEVRGGVEYCAFRGGPDPIDEWAGVVGAVISRIPAGAPRPERVHQRPPIEIGNADCGRSTYEETLLAPVRDRLDPRDIWPADDDVHPSFAWPERFPCGGEEDGGLFLAVQAASAAVGLPPALASDERRCRADGQARSQLALWLGAQSSSTARDALAALLDDGDAWRGQHLEFPSGRGFGWDTPPVWAVAWYRDDVAAAVRLADHSPASVAAALAPHWDGLLQPATPATDLWRVVDPAAPAGAARADGDGRCA